MKYTYAELAGMIDHSLLHPTLTESEMEAGCHLALNYRVASVCVRPCDVKRAAELLQGSTVATGTVVGFPHGSSAATVKRFETGIACSDGAREIDMVINVGKALSSDWSYVEHEIREVCDEAHGHEALVKVIIETDFLPNDEIKTALCKIIEQAGADFVKTSTGYGFVRQPQGGYNYRGATPHDLKLMRAACSEKVKVKAAGGVRDLDTLILCRDLGATRVGASATAAILDEYHKRERGEDTRTSANPPAGY